MQLTELLRMHKINADFYHAGLAAELRTAKQDDWINNKTRIIICTNAFGMGIDKPDVRVVVHYEVPECLENYYQEAGRAGRDGKRAYAVLLYNKNEPAEIILNLETRYPSAEKLKEIYISLMNYLQVAAGTGEGLSFDIDISVFAQRFKLNILEATYGIQALGKEGLLSFNETMFKNATAEFTVNKNDLEEFQIQHPNLEPLIKGLLRSYEGIYDFPVSIYEGLLANFLKKTLTDVKKELNELHKYGIISYKPAADKPEIFLLRNRMYTDDFKIDTTALATRRNEAYKRAKTIEGFVLNNLICRSKIIAEYFGDNNVTDCGICDNCINNTAAKLNPAEFKEVSEKIISLVAAERVTTADLLKKLKPLRQRSIWQVISFLLREEIISAGDNNVLTIK